MKAKSKQRQKPQNELSLAPESEETPSDFSFDVARIAVAQICQAAGFKSVQLSALETLTRVATMYLQAIAKSSASSAATANRSDSNFFDLANALHDLRSIHGFSGASTLHRTDYCLFSSSVLAELSDFVDCAVETPFARPIPRPRFESGKETDAMNPIPRSVRPRHVPEWLPELPDGSKCDAVLGNGPRHGEELWENFLSKNGIRGVLIENGDVGVAETKPESESVSELGAKRGKVRFKIGGKRNGLDLGVNLRSGVWKGGKRVCWDNHRNRNGFKQDYINSIVGNVDNI